MAMDIKLELRKALVFWIKVPQKLAVIGESKWFDLDPMIWGLFFNKIRKMVSWSVTGSTHKHPREEGLPLRFAGWTPGWSLEHWFKARTWTQDPHCLTRFPKYQDKRRGFLLLFCWSSLTEILGEELVKQTGSITVTSQSKKRHTGQWTIQWNISIHSRKPSTGESKPQIFSNRRRQTLEYECTHCWWVHSTVQKTQFKSQKFDQTLLSEMPANDVFVYINKIGYFLWTFLKYYNILTFFPLPCL